MKLAFITVMIIANVLFNNPQKPPIIFRVTSFKEVPKEMEGCGENFFLNKQDEKSENFIFYTDYVRGLICVNNRIILMNSSHKSKDKNIHLFSNKDYSLLIKYGPIKTTGDESYEIKSAIIILKYHSTIVWTKNVIGGGGC